jgi:transposase InsO family protein
MTTREIQGHLEEIYGKYGLEVPAAISSMAIACVRTSIRSPWQNGVAERWVGSCRYDLLDHIIALNECHLKRLLADYVRYYHEDRTHMACKSKHPAAEFVQQLALALFLACGWGACTTATIRPRKTICSKTTSAALRS